MKNGSIVNINNRNSLEQNKELLKTSKHYYIEYQYIIVDAEDDDSSRTRRRNADLDNLGQRIYYGRINRIEFKLCHEYCETCLELGTSYNDQECLSCLPLYQFDFLYYNRSYNDNAQVNCVPEEYYNKLYNLNRYILIPCNRDDCKFYHNVTDNKTICFDESYDCPILYPIYDEEAKICHSCNYSLIKEGKCSLDVDNNTSQEEIYEIIKNGIIPDFVYTGDFLKISGANNFAYQISSFKTEYSYLKENKGNDFSIIDLKECADILRKENGLNPNDDLTILKYENDDYNNSNGNDKSAQYEVYSPNSNKKLDLSVCSNVKIDIYIPIKLDEKTQKLYDNLKSQGYDLFDKNDKFYKDICTPYKSQNGTDVLLSDRYNDFFTPNQLICQANCEYSDYNPETKYMKCECNIVNNEKIEVKEPKKVTAKSIAKSFYNILKYSNYKVLKCYKLVFRAVTFTKNIGSILSYSYFIGFILGLIIFCFRKFVYLQEEIEKLFENYYIKEKKDKKKDKNKNIDMEIEKDNGSIKVYPVINKDNKENNEKINFDDINKDYLKYNDKYNDDIKNEVISQILKYGRKKKFTIKFKKKPNLDNNINNVEKSETIKESNYDKSKSKILSNKKNKDIFKNKLPILDEPISSDPINNNIEEIKEEEEYNDNNIDIKSKKETKNAKELY